MEAYVKRYLVFAYEAYYPVGGWSDLAGSFHDRAEALALAETLYPKSTGGVEVIDLETETDIYIYPQHREVTP
jgi:hypothetical protein